MGLMKKTPSQAFKNMKQITSSKVSDFFISSYFPPGQLAKQIGFDENQTFELTATNIYVLLDSGQCLEISLDKKNRSILIAERNSISDKSDLIENYSENLDEHILSYENERYSNGSMNILGKSIVEVKLVRLLKEKATVRKFTNERGVILNFEDGTAMLISHNITDSKLAGLTITRSVKFLSDIEENLEITTLAARH